MRRAGWVVMTVLATGIAGYGAFLLAVPGFGPPFIAELRVDMPWALFGHVGGGLVAIAVGPWQFNARLRSRAVQVHRWMGRTYLISVLISGVSGLVLATRSQEGFVTHVGFGLLAVLWLTATTRAYFAIRAGDQATHREWMIRSFALTLAAVTLRVMIPLGMASGLSFHDVYTTVSWACWVPNLIVAEWIVLRRRGGAPSRPIGDLA